MVGAGRRPRGHAEIAALIPRYAAGALQGDMERSVRSHLASGCAACRRELYRRPVGVTRDVSEPSRQGSIGWRIAGPLALLLSVIATTIGASLLLGVPTLAKVDPKREPDPPSDTSRGAVSEVPPIVPAMPVHRPSGGSEAGASHQRAAVPRMAASQPERSGALPPPPPFADKLAASLLRPGTTLKRLRASGRGIGGWVVWDPALGRVFVYAHGVPRLARPWTTALTLEGGVLDGPMRRSRDGGLWVTFDLSPTSCPQRVEVVVPGERRNVLEKSLGVCPPKPAT